MREWLGILPFMAALSTTTGFVLYTRQTFIGQSRPQIVSWFLWAFLATLNAFSFRGMNDTLTALQFLAGSAGCILTFIYVLIIGKFSKPKKEEWRMMIAGVIAIVIWMNLGPTMANMLLMVVAIWSFIPTFKVVSDDPSSEKQVAWWFWTGASVLTSIFTFSKMGLTLSMVMPVTLAVLHGTVPLLIIKGRGRTRI